jgi:hypothetical protein
MQPQIFDLADHAYAVTAEYCKNAVVRDCLAHHDLLRCNECLMIVRSPVAVNLI